MNSSYSIYYLQLNLLLLLTKNFPENCHQMPYLTIPIFRNPLLKILDPPLMCASVCNAAYAVIASSVVILSVACCD